MATIFSLTADHEKGRLRLSDKLTSSQAINK